MKRRFCKSVLLWMVPLLIARALIPAGFMLMAGTDGMALMFCSGNMSTTSTSTSTSTMHAGHATHDAAMHAVHAPADHEATSHTSNSEDKSADNALCPFAVAAFAATVDVPHLQVSGPAPIDEPFVAVIPPVSEFSAAYANPIRGPPRFS